MLMTKENPGIANRLQHLREKAELTQEQLAAAAGVTLSNLAQIEQGVIMDPRVSTLAAIARALGVGLDDLTGGASEVPAPVRKPKRKRE